MSQTSREQLLTQKQQLIEELANLKQIIGEDGEQTLLEAISQYHWYSFKNKREIIFDSHTGFLFPNFQYMSYISYNDWKNVKKEYAPNDIGKGQWQCLHDNYYFSWMDQKTTCGNVKEYGQNCTYYLMSDFPFKFLGETEGNFYYFSYKNSRGIVEGTSYFRLLTDKYDKTMKYPGRKESDDKFWNHRMISSTTQLNM